ncbi:MAG TPA: tetratricopeptide repeat protein [Myxococcaceae bacterium]
MGRRAALILLAGALACSRGPARSSGNADLVTTDGRLARSNLDAMVESHEGMVRREPGWGSARLSLVTLLLARGSSYGRIEDLEAAEQVAESGVRAAPRSPEAWLARASARAGLHRFAEAGEDLERAESLGAEPDAVRAQRASIALARGEVDTALELSRARASREPGMATSSALAVVLSESGDSAGAEAELARALASYRDTSPFPVAFVEFRQGLLAERAGDLERAAGRYGAALRGLPGHAQAAVHLASVEMARNDLEGAAAALASVLTEASDPEIAATRAELARRRGDLGTASRETEVARAGYLALLGRHPDAFADHAARFFLDRDPRESLRWATHNLEVRRTTEAFDLALTAALRTGDSSGCRIAREASALPRTTPRLRALTAEALRSCPGSAAGAAL